MKFITAMLALFIQGAPFLSAQSGEFTGDIHITRGNTSDIPIPPAPSAVNQPSNSCDNLKKPQGPAKSIQPGEMALCSFKLLQEGKLHSDVCGKVKMEKGVDENYNNPISRRFDATAGGFVAWDNREVWVDTYDKIGSGLAHRGYEAFSQAINMPDYPKGQMIPMDILHQRLSQIRSSDPQVSLARWIAQQPSGSIDPAVLFYKAVMFTGGNTRGAYYVCHNVLKILGRVANDRSDKEGAAYTEYADSSPFMKQFKVICSDNAGCWYHFFGTAAFAEFVGDWSISALAGYVDEYIFKKYLAKQAPAEEKIWHNKAGVIFFRINESFFCEKGMSPTQILGEYQKCGLDPCKMVLH
jgi:hypothetical protein